MKNQIASLSLSDTKSDLQSEKSFDRSGDLLENFNELDDMRMW